MKSSELINKLFSAPDTQEHEPPERLTQGPTGMSLYPRDAKATLLAVQLVGDGKTPDIFFVSIGDEFLSEGDIGENYCIGQFDDPEKAEEAYNNVILNGEEGPRWVQLENRLSGVVLHRELKRAVNYKEI